jgi:hypothetical protein
MDKNIENLLKTKDEIKDSFNKIAWMMCVHIGNKYPDTYFYIYRTTIQKYITELSYEPIALFIKYIYSNDGYRNKILTGDESFFMNENYHQYLDKTETSYNQDTSQIFVMKDVWGKMDDQNKNFVRQAFKNLVDRTELYVDVLCSINKLKKKD